jgi:hypothetical protein
MKSVSQWFQKGQAYAQGNSGIHEPPPHAPDFYRGVLSELVKDPITVMWVMLIGPFKGSLDCQLESGAIRKEELRFLEDPIFWEQALASVSVETESKLVIRKGGVDYTTPPPLTAVCSHPEIKLIPGNLVEALAFAAC